MNEEKKKERKKNKSDNFMFDLLNFEKRLADPWDKLLQ